MHHNSRCVGSEPTRVGGTLKGSLSVGSFPLKYQVRDTIKNRSDGAFQNYPRLEYKIIQIRFTYVYRLILNISEINRSAINNIIT